jgi:8-amino-7-oxononanoate synthase
MPNKPDLNHLTSPLGAEITFKGENYLYFGGTAYLGIPQNRAFLELYQKGLHLFGLNNGTSRSNNVQLGIYDEVENYAADRFGSQAALITSSGFLAAQMLVKQVEKLGQVRYAPATHPALWGHVPPQTTGSFAAWAMAVVTEINGSAKKNWVLFSNSMNNLYPEIYDFSFLTQLRAEKNVLLVVDDSHGIGVNNNGLSALSATNFPENVNVLVVASMAKALGVDAGIILGDKNIIAELKNSNAFFGASPPSAAGLYAFMQGEKIYEEELAKLQILSSALAKELAGTNDWHFIPHFPVFLSKNADLSANLSKHQIVISSFPYPDKDGDVVNRIVLSSWHTGNDLKKLTATIKLL